MIVHSELEDSLLAFRSGCFPSSAGLIHLTLATEDVAVPGDILLGQKCRTVIDKNGTSYLTMTGKEKQTTHGILGVYYCHYIIVLFFKSSKL